MLNNRNMYISHLEIIGERIITMLNKLPDMSISRHSNRRYMQIMIKLLQVKYGPGAAVHLGTTNHTGIETSTTRRWFYHSLSKQSPTSS